MYKNKKVFVLGMARSGYAVAKLLGKENQVVVTDVKAQDEEHVRELENMGVDVVITEDACQELDESFDVIVKNPGIKYNHPCVLKARELDIPVINELEVAYEYLNKKVEIIGITGSNGKTTTTTMIYEILHKALNNVYLAGNIGTPLCEVAENIPENSYLVIEISDHQLCDMYSFKTNVSVVTNISEVHLDFHDSFARYKMMKKRIFNNHTNNDLAIINKDNEGALEISEDIPARKEYFSKEGISDCYFKEGNIYYHNELVIETDKLIVKGMHNYENIMGAILVAKHYEVSNDIIREVLYNFKGVEHRIEFVKNLKGRAIYNDSKSTNVESTKTALMAFDKPIILLLGGLDRGHSFEELAPLMKNVKLVVCYGETKERIKDFCEKHNFQVEVVDTIVEATKVAYDKSREGDIILLSPACASWDQFDCFEDRGNLFKKTVESLGE